MDYPIGFLNELENSTKNEILKGFIDAIFENAIDVQTIPDEKLRKNWIRLLSEADRAAAVMEGKLAHVHSGARRQQRRTKTAKERAKEAGLVVLEPNIKAPKKLILE